MTEKNPFENYFEDEESPENGIENSGVTKNTFSKNDNESTTETSSSAKNTAKELKKSSGNGKKGVVIAGVSALALAGLIGGLGVTGVVDFGSLLGGDKDSKKEATKKGSGNQDGEDGDPEESAEEKPSNEYSWAKKQGKVFPVKTNKWESDTHYTEDNQAPEKKQEEIMKDQFKKFSSFDYYGAAVDLPSEAAGFTSDANKLHNDDGTLNPMYSYWTKEVFISETNNILNRLLNPIYGNWVHSQYAGGMNEEGSKLLASRFQDIIKIDGSDSSNVPVFADRGNNDYGLGDQLLGITEGVRWYGDLQSTETLFTYNDAKGQYDVSMRLNVKYLAWSKQGKVLEKNGIIDLKIVANNENIVPSNNKVVIESGILTIL